MIEPFTAVARTSMIKATERSKRPTEGLSLRFQNTIKIVIQHNVKKIPGGFCMMTALCHGKAGGAPYAKDSRKRAKNSALSNGIPMKLST